MALCCPDHLVWVVSTWDLISEDGLLPGFTWKYYIVYSSVMCFCALDARRWYRTSWITSGSLSKNYKQCWVVTSDLCWPVTSKTDDKIWQIQRWAKCIGGGEWKVEGDCCFPGNPYEDGNDAHFAFMLNFCHTCCMVIVLITTYSKYLCVQAEPFRQRHPVWKPGGDPHLPAGTMCGFGGLYQVWKHSCLSCPNECTHPALVFIRTAPHLLRCTHTVIYIELQEVFVFSLLLIFTKSFSLSGPLQSLGRSAESGGLLFKPDGSDQNPVPDLLFQPPFSCVHPDWPQVSSCTQNSRGLTLF